MKDSNNDVFKVEPSLVDTVLQKNFFVKERSLTLDFSEPQTFDFKKLVC